MGGSELFNFVCICEFEVLFFLFVDGIRSKFGGGGWFFYVCVWIEGKEFFLVWCCKLWDYVICELYNDVGYI